ncbi:MAG: response regulator [Chloroflexota bacterium]
MNDALRILIVDDDRYMASTLIDILNMQGYHTELAYSPEDALELARQAEFDCVISDIVMQGMSGVALCAALRQLQPEMVVILMTAYASEQQSAKGLEKGALAVLNKPLDLAHLLQFLDFLKKTQTIAIVDDDPEFCRTLSNILTSRGYSVKLILDDREALDSISGNEQVILLDMKLNNASGDEVLRKIRQRYPNLPVLLVTGYGVEMASAIARALAIDAYACLYKPLVVPELLKTLAEIRSRHLKKVLSH